MSPSRTRKATITCRSREPRFFLATTRRSPSCGIPLYKAWFPDGLEDPNLALLVVTTNQGGVLGLAQWRAAARLRLRESRRYRHPRDFGGARNHRVSGRLPPATFHLAASRPFAQPSCTVGSAGFSGEDAYTESLLASPPPGVTYTHYEGSDRLRRGASNALGAAVYRAGGTVGGRSDLAGVLRDRRAIRSGPPPRVLRAAWRRHRSRQRTPVLLSESGLDLNDLREYRGWERRSVLPGSRGASVWPCDSSARTIRALNRRDARGLLVWSEWARTAASRAGSTGRLPCASCRHMSAPHKSRRDEREFRRDRARAFFLSGRTGHAEEWGDGGRRVPRDSARASIGRRA